MRRGIVVAGLWVLAVSLGLSLAWAIDLPGGLGGGTGASSGPSLSDLMKGCEKGSNDARAACYRDAANKAKTAADACDQQAAKAKDAGMKKSFEQCRDQGNRSANVLQCIADGATKAGAKIDDLKKTCPATAGVKLG